MKFRNRTIDLVSHRWISITVWSLVSHLSLYAVLLVALRDVGVSDAEVGWAEVLAVFAFARLVTAIPITPGGAGLVEGALIGGLIGAGGDEAAGGRRGADLPGVHLGAADLGRHALLCVVATPGHGRPRGPRPPARGRAPVAATPVAATMADQCFQAQAARSSPVAAACPGRLPRSRATSRTKSRTAAMARPIAAPPSTSSGCAPRIHPGDRVQGRQHKRDHRPAARQHRGQQPGDGEGDDGMPGDKAQPGRMHPTQYRIRDRGPWPLPLHQ